MRVQHHVNILHTTCDICARAEILEDAIIQNTHSMAGPRPSYSQACTDIAKMQPIFYRRGRATIQPQQTRPSQSSVSTDMAELQPSFDIHGRATAHAASTDTAELQPSFDRHGRATAQLRQTRPSYSPALTGTVELQTSLP